MPDKLYLTHAEQVCYSAPDGSWWKPVTDKANRSMHFEIVRDVRHNEPEAAEPVSKKKRAKKEKK